MKAIHVLLTLKKKKKHCKTVTFELAHTSAPFLLDTVMLESHYKRQNGAT